MRLFFVREKFDIYRPVFSLVKSTAAHNVLLYLSLYLCFIAFLLLLSCFLFGSEALVENAFKFGVDVHLR